MEISALDEFIVAAILSIVTSVHDVLGHGVGGEEQHHLAPHILGEGVQLPPDVLHQSELSIHAAVGCRPIASASKRSIRRFVITEKAPTRTFSWLKAATTAFTFKTLLRHYAKWALTPRSLNVKLGPRHKGHKRRAGWLA